MTLRLPEPLPYDFVDELIEQQIQYWDTNVYHEVECEPEGQEPTYEHTYKTIVAYPPGGWAARGNVCRQMVQVLHDSDQMFHEFDDDGYVTNWIGGQTFRQPIEEEAELDKWIDIIFGTNDPCMCDDCVTDRMGEECSVD